ncbi:MAG: 30S ribosomal protein S6 [Candidatus Staskawiczbacteria bacterium]|jgi:small subunit ribosomal protein S6
MKTYELTYIVSPEITSEEAEAKVKEIESLIQRKEGIIVRQNNPIAKTLAYPIKKRASGFFGVLEFQLEPEKLIEIKEVIAKNGEIVRHMVIIKEPAKPRKERRTRVKPRPEGYPDFEKPFDFTHDEEQKTEIKTAKDEKPTHVKNKIEKEKVELKDIEQQLDEILGE